MENQFRYLAVIVVVFFAILFIFNNPSKNEVSTYAVNTQDNYAPSVSIDSQYFLNNNVLTLSGIALDNSDLQRIMVKLNNGRWQPASGTSSWGTTMTLSKGVNTVYVQAFDGSDNASPVSSKTFTI